MTARFAQCRAGKEEGGMWDVIVIGAGVCGCAAARELSRYNADILLLDAAEDIALGASNREISLVYSGYLDAPESFRSIFTRMGNVLHDRLCLELGVPLIRAGSMLIALDDEDVRTLHALQLQGEGSGLEGLTILDGERLHALEPALSEDARAALFAPASGVVNGKLLTRALWENARQNGVDFERNARVREIRQRHAGFALYSDDKAYVARTVVNAAGIFADEVSALVTGKAGFSLTPYRAESLIIRRPGIVSSIGHPRNAFPPVAALDGRAALGPLLREASDKRDDALQPGMATRIVGRTRRILPEIEAGDIIEHRQTMILPKSSTGDFLIGAVPDVPGFYQVAGIDMPGMTAAPAIGRYIASLVAEYLQLSDNAHFIPGPDEGAARTANG